ncbi:MAG: UDP-N-acetylmuramate dehydrogenase [Candidatus Omnitrophota bacterium]
MDLSFLNGINISIITNAPLNQYTTFRLGGNCPALIECPDASTLIKTVLRLRKYYHPFLLMGFGSNILASDTGINKIVLRFNNEMPQFKREGNLIVADAANHLDNLTQYAAEQGLEGLSQICGIPGTIGGAIAGNAGAYGQQISDHLSAVTILKPDNTIVRIPKTAIRFDYRDSDFKHNDDIILTAEFALNPIKDTASLQAERTEILKTRPCNINLWKDVPCAGSFFRNVDPTSKAGQRQSAGWFLDHAGCKTLNINGAHAYTQHANIITRDEGTTAQSVYDLTTEMINMVKDKFKITLVREVRLLGKFENAPECKIDNYW